MNIIQPDQSLALPTSQQVAWQDLEQGSFIHFAPNTWQDQPFDDHSTPLHEINPTQLDTDQWVSVAAAAGSRYIIIVAKHVGGFCLWQTDTNAYSIRNTPWRDGQGDIVADLARSCAKQGMKLGIYLSPQDESLGAGVGGRTKQPEDQPRYNELFRRQLTELLTRYGPICEVWFDGSVVVPVADILNRLAPTAMIFQSELATIRWVGNETGLTPYPAWNAVRHEDAKSGIATASVSVPDGDTWLPIEADTTLTDDWFWRTDNAHKLKPLDHLVETYYRSVGHGSVLLINQTPDRTGLIPSDHAERLREFGDEIRRRFAVPLTCGTGVGDIVDLPLPAPTLIDHVVSADDIRLGERVREYVIEGRCAANGPWQELCFGTAIGHKKIDRFRAVEVVALRLRVTRCAAVPHFRVVEAFHAGGILTEFPPPFALKSEYLTLASWSREKLASGKLRLTVPVPGDQVEATRYRVLLGARHEGVQIAALRFQIGGSDASHLLTAGPSPHEWHLTLTGLSGVMELEVELTAPPDVDSAGTLAIWANR